LNLEIAVFVLPFRVQDDPAFLPAPHRKESAVTQAMPSVSIFESARMGLAPAIDQGEAENNTGF
jgi:hypothetical protein